MTRKWKRNKAGSLLGTWKAVYITKLVSLKAWNCFMFNLNYSVKFHSVFSIRNWCYIYEQFKMLLKPQVYLHYFPTKKARWVRFKECIQNKAPGSSLSIYSYSCLLKWQWKNTNVINPQGQRDQEGTNQQISCQQNWTRVAGWLKTNLADQEMLNFKFSVNKFIKINPIT